MRRSGRSVTIGGVALIYVGIGGIALLARRMGNHVSGESGQRGGVPIRRVLVANRGEIAMRIVRACHELGIEAVAVYGPGEENAQHVLAADDAYRLPETAGIPYLNVEGLVAVGMQAGADAVHPGYGFLAENAGFAAAVAAAGMTFIGPSPDVIAAMGDKVEARRVAIAAGVPVVPGTQEPVASVEEAYAWAEVHGYPVAVKAAGGGGGRGFRVARTPDELPDAFAGSHGEAERYFSNPVVYLERYLERPRHIEIQVFGDTLGTVVALPERDCSVQRRHQKLIEESPSTAVTPDLRARLQEATVALGERVGYLGAGTVEYLLDTDGSFYFLEMNTRIQVEHTVTEMVTGIDLVAEQIRVAEGHPLSFGGTPAPNGWAFEARINAEDAARGFVPAPGTLATYREPAGFGVRVDAAFRQGETIPASYDSMIAKLVTWGRDRDEALRRLRRALNDFRVEGVPTTIPFHLAATANPAFVSGDVFTTFLADHPDVLEAASAPGTATVPGAADDVLDRTSLVVEVGGRRFSVDVLAPMSAGAEATPANGTRRNGRARKPRSGGAGSRSAGDADTIASGVQGTVVRVNVAPGDEVVAGQVVAVVEAMKMENDVVAQRAGTVAAVEMEPGASVAIGVPIVRLEAAASTD
ncbi:MAG: biotin carboxylase N-terminal domain-containing protein [Thermomicrobiales bacterium]